MKCINCNSEMWNKPNSYFLVCPNCGTTLKIDVKNKKMIWKSSEFKTEYK
jgi:predicted RNA-binding Zn-ribbon protein involved in translation (DUF1610 family)